LWLDHHEWLYTLLKSTANVSPTFRFPDLISACISLVLADEAAPERVFDHLGRSLVPRDFRTPRRREHVWREQYERLRTLQLSVSNRHPHPMFQLDRLTTACVALVRTPERPVERLLEHARRNTAGRATRSQYSRTPA
jgi:hypothetical protein